MPKPMIRIHDVETDTIIDREMTVKEIASLEADAAALKALEDSTAAKVAAKEAALQKLGLTEEELKAALS